MYRIGTFSQLVKLTVKTLRFYDEAGLLKPETTDPATGYRYYTSRQLYQLQRIVAFRRAGFSVKEIRRIQSGTDVASLLERKQAELTRESETVRERLVRLESIRKSFSEEQNMEYQAIVKTLPACVVYYKRFRVHDFAEYARAIPQIGAEAAAANPDLKCAEPDYCYVEYLDGEYREHDFTVEYAQAVERFGTECGEIRFKQLPETQVACVMHRGSYEGLPKAYAYLVNWVEQNGYVVTGNAREQYLDGCWNCEREEDYLTEVQFPVRKADPGAD